MRSWILGLCMGICLLGQCAPEQVVRPAAVNWPVWKVIPGG